MSSEELEFKLKQIITWYENKLATTNDIEKKKIYSNKLEVLDEVQDKLF